MFIKGLIVLCTVSTCSLVYGTPTLDIKKIFSKKTWQKTTQFTAVYPVTKECPDFSGTWEGMCDGDTEPYTSRLSHQISVSRSWNPDFTNIDVKNSGFAADLI